MRKFALGLLAASLLYTAAHAQATGDNGVVVGAPAYSASTLPGGPYLPLAGGTLTGPELLPDGTKAAPALAFSSATGNGLYWRSGILAALAGNSGKETFQFGSFGNLAIAGNTFSMNSSAGSDISTTPNNWILTVPAAATGQFGAADVTTGAVAQTLTFQGNTASTTNGPLALIKGAGGGSSTSVGGELRLQGGLSSAAAGTGGAITFYTAPAAAGNAGVLALTINSTGQVLSTGLIQAGGQLKSLTSVVTPSSYFFNGSSEIRNISDGVVSIFNNAGTQSVQFTVGTSNLLTLNGGLLAGYLSPSAATVPSGLNGITLAAANVLGFYTNGGPQFYLNSGSGYLYSDTASGPAIQNIAASSTVPTFTPNRASATTGIGAQASGNMSLIAGGVEQVRVTNGTVLLQNIGTDAAATDSSLCLVTSTKAVVTGTGTLGICLGTSSARYKHDIAPLGYGLASILALKPVSYRLNADHGDPTKVLYGFTAEDMAPVIPALVGLDGDGKPNTADYLGLVPVLVRAVQELQAEVDALKAERTRTLTIGGPPVPIPVAWVAR